jgi:hypothetical protein
MATPDMWANAEIVERPATRGDIVGGILEIAGAAVPIGRGGGKIVGEGAAVLSRGATLSEGAVAAAARGEAAALTAAREGVPLTGVARFDAPAVESAHFKQFIRGVEERGFEVRESMSMTREEPAFIRPGQRRFVYSPKHMTYLDMRHELRHFQQLRQSGSLRIGGGRAQAYERAVYEYERSLGERHGFSKEYMEYLDKMIRFYGGK